MSGPEVRHLALALALMGTALLARDGRSCDLIEPPSKDPAPERSWEIEGSATGSMTSDAVVDGFVVSITVETGSTPPETAIAIADALNSELPPPYSADPCYTFGEMAWVDVSRSDMTEITEFVAPEFDGQLIQEVITLSVLDTEDSIADLVPIRLSVRSTGSAVDFEIGLDVRSRVTLSVFDVQGREVGHVLDEVRPSGSSRILWDRRAPSGNRVGGGVYFARLVAGDRTLTHKFVLIDS